MYRTTLILIFCLFLFLSPVAAQFEVLEPWPDAEISYVLTIDNDGVVGLTTPKSSGEKTVNQNELKEFFMRLAAKKKSAESTWFKDVVTIKPSAGTWLETLVAFIHSIRNAYTSKIRIESEGSSFVRVPKKPVPAKRPNPNPLTLVVSVDKVGKIDLNREPQGTLSNTSSLTDRLKEVFKARDENGVIRVNSNVVETTVFLKLPLTISWGDAVKVIRAVRDGGGDPIGLQIENLEK